ncbi:hypothetical protein, partial [Acinetobacter sp. YH12251]
PTNSPKNDFTLKVPTMEGIHLLYLEINKIFSLSCQPICNSAIYSPFGWRTSSAPPKPTFITLPYPATFNPSITAILPVHITLSRLIISAVTLANLAAISMSGICPLIPMMMRTAALT